MKKRTVSGVLLALLLVGVLLASFEIKGASASPSVRIYVDMPPQGYIPGIPVGQFLKVSINIESPAEWRDTANGIVGWAFFVQVDPEVLEPMGVKCAIGGYFLYDFAQEHGYSTAKYGLVDKEAGIFWDRAEFINGFGMLGVGAGGDGKLCELWLKSKSQTAYTSIDIYHWTPGGVCQPRYWTPDGQWHSFDVVEDGHYNSLELPATIDVDPNTLNLRSGGQWVTGYIELPEGYDVSDIDVSSVMLNDTIPVSLLDVPAPDPVPTEIGDHDADGIPDLMVKFDRAMISELILSHCITDDQATLTITGEVGGTPFSGEDTIEVILGAGGSKSRK